MSRTSDDKWRDCDFVGIIKKNDERPEKHDVEILDDYDMRNGCRGRFHKFKTMLERMEC